MFAEYPCCNQILHKLEHITTVCKSIHLQVEVRILLSASDVCTVSTLVWLGIYLSKS